MYNLYLSVKLQESSLLDNRVTSWDLGPNSRITIESLGLIVFMILGSTV